jgi:hypothetical protein
VPRHGARRRRPPSPEAAAFAGGGDQRHLHVLDNAHRDEGLRDLEGPADAEAPDLARRLAGRCPARQHDGAGIGLQLTADHVEGGRLSCAVRADDGDAARRRPRSNDTSLAATSAAEAICQDRDGEEEAHVAALVSTRSRRRSSASRSALGRADDARGKSQHHGDDRDDRGSRRQWSVKGMKNVLDRVEGGGADQRSDHRLHAAEQRSSPGSRPTWRSRSSSGRSSPWRRRRARRRAPPRRRRG